MNLGKAELGSHSNPAISQLGDLGASLNTEVSATLAEMLGKLLVLGITVVRAQTMHIKHLRQCLDVRRFL